MSPQRRFAGTFVLMLAILAMGVPSALPVRGYYWNNHSMNGNQDLLADPGRPLLYYANGGGVEFINASTGEIGGTVTVGSYPTSLDLSPDGQLLYAADSASAQVSVVGLRTRQVVRTLNLSFRPLSIRHGRPDRFYLSDASNDTVRIVNATTGAVIRAFLPTAGLANPVILDANPAGNTLVVSPMGVYANDIFVYNVSTDTPTLVGQVSNIANVFNQQVIDWGHGLLYRAPGGQGIEVISLNSFTEVASLSLPNWPLTVAISPDGRVLYGGSGASPTPPYGSPELYAYSTSTLTLLGVLPLPVEPAYLAITSANDAAFVGWTPTTRVSFAPSISIIAPSPGASYSAVPRELSVSVSLGIPTRSISNATYSLNGVPLAALVENVNLSTALINATLRSVLTDGWYTASIRMIVGQDVLSQAWTFVVNTSGWVSSVIYVMVTHQPDFRIPLPSTWLHREDVSVGGVSFELVAQGLTYGTLPTTLVVSSLHDSSARESAGYLEELALGTLAEVRLNYTSAYLAAGPTYRSVSNHTAVVFTIRYGTPNPGSPQDYEDLSQEGALVVDGLTHTDWLILLEVDNSEYPAMNQVFQHILDGFQVTNPLGNAPGVSAWAIFLGSVAVGACLGVGAYLALSRRRRKQGGEPPEGWIENPDE